MNLLADLLVSPSTPITVPAGAAYTLALGLILVTWKASNKLRDIEQALVNVNGKLKETWSKIYMERWATRLEKSNRKIELYVPRVTADLDEDETTT